MPARRSSSSALRWARSASACAVRPPAAAAVEERHGHGARDGEGRQRAAGGQADDAVVADQRRRRPPLALRRTDHRFGGADAGLRGQELGPAGVGPGQHVLERRRAHRNVGHLVDQREFLAQRQADEPRQTQLGLLEVVLRRNGRGLLLASSRTSLRTTSMPATTPAAAQLLRLPVERLRRLQLRAGRLPRAPPAATVSR